MTASPEKNPAKLPKARLLEKKSEERATAWILLQKKSEKRVALTIGLVVLAMGWIFAWQINNWHLTTPVIMLWFGWFGVLLTLRFLWAAGAAIWVGDVEAEGSFDVSLSRSRELEEEKKSLLRAIKEIEFDRDLGKMSDPDAKEMMRFYRARAIEVIKEIDGLSDSEMTVDQRVDRDVEARLTIAQKTTKRKTKASSVKAKSVKAKDAEATRADAKTVEAKSAEANDAEANDVDAKTVEAKSAEAKSAEAKSAEAKSAEAKSAEANDAESNEVDANDVDATSGPETNDDDANANDVESEFVKVESVKAESVESEFVESEFVDAKAVEATGDIANKKHDKSDKRRRRSEDESAETA